MTTITICRDSKFYLDKPSAEDTVQIQNRIGKLTKQLTLRDIRGFADNVSLDGFSFCPATFKDGKRTRENFEQMQMFVLDFHGGVSFSAVYKRAGRYNLPILFGYTTYSSRNQDRFRVAFLNDVPVLDVRVAEIIQNALMTVFPEASKTSGDVTRMYFGGASERLVFNEEIAEINLESVIRGMSAYLHDRHGKNHFKEKIARFAELNGVTLRDSGLLDVSVTENPEDRTGLLGTGNKMPISTMLSNHVGEKFPYHGYRINLGDSGANRCLSDTKTSRTPHRLSALENLRSTCQLWAELADEKRKLRDSELLGLSTNVVQIESGSMKIRDILSANPSYYNDEKRGFWNFNLSYLKQNGYEPWSCNRFCPYQNACQHGKTILSTAKPRGHTVERLSGGVEDDYYPVDEVFENVGRNFDLAMDADDTDCHIINAQTAIGKTEIYLTRMADSMGRFMVAVPTNILKHDVLRRAKALGMKVMETPSLDEIKDKIPHEVWKRIEKLRKSGRHRAVNSYIHKVLAGGNIRCLADYLLKLQDFEVFDGHVITTHQRLLYMSESTLKKYDAIIIDEDIIAGSILPNHIEIPISTLEKLKKKLKKTETSHRLAGKITEMTKKVSYLKDRESENLFTLRKRQISPRLYRGGLI